MLLLILFAFLGGVVTILSPCILPILPIVLSGSVGGGKKKPFGIVTGFVVSFTFFTLFLTSIVKATGVSPDILRNFSVFVLIAFGLVLIIPQIQAKMEMLFSKLATKVPNKSDGEGFSGGFVIGLSLGLLWTPCVGPILASIISLAFTGTVTGSAVIITLAYAVGTTLPMLVIMYGGRNLLHKVPWLLKNTTKIQKIFGVIMIVTAIGIFFNIDRQFQSYVLEKFPQYGTGLTGFEDSDLIRDELDNINKVEKVDKNMNYDNNYTVVPAPELIVGGKWLNSKPLRLEDLRGKVVLLDFMTYTCINCIRTFPYLNTWYDKYKDNGLVVIGIHTPEFEFEKDPDNVQKALDDFGIKFPVMQDNNYDTWRAYKNRYWPRKYLIDHNGNIVYDHAGEGNYDITEKKIQELLEQRDRELGINNNIEKDIAKLDNVETSQARSPETYFGALRNQNFGSGTPFQKGTQTFAYPDNIKPNTLYLVGEWNIQDEYAEAKSLDAKIIFRYFAKNNFLVATTDDEKPVVIDVKLDGELVTKNKGSDVDGNGQVQISQERLYRLIEADKADEHIIEINITEPGLRVFAFTFG